VTGQSPALEIPAAWRRAALRIAERGWRKVLVIGAVDRGKSSFCRFLARYLTEAGHGVAFVDADIGQKDVGPPATISLARPGPDGDLTTARAEALYFVGAVSPMAHFASMVIGTRRLVDSARAEFVVIDTTGLVHGRGATLKALKIEALRPDVVVLLEREAELAPIVRAHRHLNLLRLQPSPAACRKSDRARRDTREAAFRTYFAGAGRRVLGLDRLVLQRALLFTGEPVEDDRFVYAERVGDELLGVTAGEDCSHEDGLRILPAHFAGHLLCGLADRHGDCLGLGLIERIDFQLGALSLITPVPQRRIRVLQFGDLHLSQDGRELRHSRLCLF